MRIDCLRLVRTYGRNVSVVRQRWLAGNSANFNMADMTVNGRESAVPPPSPARRESVGKKLAASPWNDLSTILRRHWFLIWLLLRTTGTLVLVVDLVLLVVVIASAIIVGAESCLSWVVPNEISKIAPSRRVGLRRKRVKSHRRPWSQLVLLLWKIYATNQIGTRTRRQFVTMVGSPFVWQFAIHRSHTPESQLWFGPENRHVWRNHRRPARISEQHA
jgi:hypothetical protein